jgi:hypothetical protein
MKKCPYTSKGEYGFNKLRRNTRLKNLGKYKIVFFSLAQDISERAQ